MKGDDLWQQRHAASEAAAWAAEPTDDQVASLVDAARAHVANPTGTDLSDTLRTILQANEQRLVGAVADLLLDRLGPVYYDAGRDAEEAHDDARALAIAIVVDTDCSPQRVQL